MGSLRMTAAAVQPAGVHAPHGLPAMAKRLVDIVGASIGLVVALPTMAVIAARCSSSTAGWAVAATNSRWSSSAPWTPAPTTT